MAYPATLRGWVYGDPIGYGFTVPGDWTGDWLAQVRTWRERSAPLLAEFDVVATYDAETERTTVMFSLTAEESEAVPPGVAYGDIELDGVGTFFTFTIPVEPDVSHQGAP